jgi:hypothetical protein
MARVQNIAGDTEGCTRSREIAIARPAGQCKTGWSVPGGASGEDAPVRLVVEPVQGDGFERNQEMKRSRAVQTEGRAQAIIVRWGGCGIKQV